MSVDVMAFLAAALPWVLLGLGVAFAAVAYGNWKRGEEYLLQVALLVILFSMALFGFVANPLKAQAASVSDDTVMPSIMLGDDTVWAGDEATFTKCTTHDILAAGRSITVSDSSISGSLRLAGQDVKVKNTKITHSIALAGQNVTVENSTMQAAALTAYSVAFEGKAGSLYALADNVTINGKVTGDVHVSADSLTLGPDAVVEGKIVGTLGSEPSVASGAQVGTVDVTIESGSEAEDAAASSFDLGGFLLGIASSVASFVALAVLAEVFFRKQTAGAAAMVRTRTGAHVGSGFIGLVVAPIAIVVLCCLVVTLPFAGALALSMVAMTMVGGAFAAASLAPLAFKNMGRFPAVIVLAAIMGVINGIPMLNLVVLVAGLAYLLGYVIQSVFLGMRKDPAPQAAPQQEALQQVAV